MTEADTYQCSCGETFDTQQGAASHSKTCEGMIITAEGEPSDHADDPAFRRASEGLRNPDDHMSDPSGPTVAWVGGFTFVVWSGADDGESDDQRAYRVNLGATPFPSCSCEHGFYNEENPEACWHIRRAAREAEAKPGMDLRALRDWTAALKDAYQVGAEAADGGGGGGGGEPVDGGAEDGQDDDEITPEEAADWMRETFQEHGFNVKSCTPISTDDHGEVVSFDLGHDSFDELKRVTSECELVLYDGTTNLIPVDDVPEYLQEVVRS